MLAIGILTLAALAAGPDNNVEWNGISHSGLYDKRPLCPIEGEAFEVRIQAYRDDLTAARVRFDAGAGPAWLNMSKIGQRGVYDIWGATVPATTASSMIQFYFEVTDGSDIDYYTTSGMLGDDPGSGGFEVNFVNFSHAAPGATKCSVGTLFKVWAPTRTQGWVRGSFNNFGTTNPMTKHGEYFVAYVPYAHPGDEYRYYFNPGSIWRTDPRGRSYDPGDSYNAVVRDPLAFAWATDTWSPPVIDDLVIYELHVGSFAGRNDPVPGASNPSNFADVQARIGHLTELGVNCVELMPIAEFPFDYSAGYNTISVYAPDYIYGTPDQLRSLVDALHGAGIAVLQDIIWNHDSSPDSILWNYDNTQIYFDTPAVQTPWGPQADFDRPQVRSYFLDNMHMWLEEYRFDGFRMDATSYMNIGAQEAAGWSLMQAYNQQIDNRHAGTISIAEQLPNDYYITRPTSLGGAGFDAQWWDPMTDTLRGCILSAAFGDPHMAALAWAFSGGEHLQGRELINYLEAHDEIWPSSGGQRLVKTIDTTAPHDDVWARGRHKLGHGFVFFAPGVPMFVQGAELLEDTDFAPGDQSGNSRLDWSKKTTYRGVFDFFRDAIAVKRSNGAFRASSPHSTYHVNDVGNVLIFQRWDNAGNVCVVIANFSNTDYTSYLLGLPQPGPWYELLNSQSPAYGGDGPVNAGAIQTTGGPRDGHPQSADIAVPAMGLMVLRWNHPPEPPPCPADFDENGTPTIGDIFVFLAAWFGGDSRTDIDSAPGPTIGDIFAFLTVWFAGCP